MKKLILILFVICMTACLNEKMTLTKLKEIEQKELSTGVKNDSIFIGFKFGMSEDEVTSRLNDLLSAGTISLSEDKYIYKFTFDYPKEAFANFQTQYFNNKLYKFSLKFDTESPTQAELIQLKMAELFMKKYGNLITIPNILVETRNDYVFIKGNRKIEIDYPALSSTIFVTYTDLLIEMEFDKAKNDEISKAEKKAISDI